MKSEDKKPAASEKSTEKSAEPSNKANEALLSTIGAAAKDLIFLSETDAPLTPFFWPSEADKLTPELVVQLAKLPEGTKVTAQETDEFFESAVTAEDWMNDEEKTEVKRFQELVKVLEDNLKDLTAYRAGKTNLDVFIAGKTEGGFAGVATKVVET